jgi:hypothetical protein
MMRSRREEQRLLKWKQENDAAREAEAKRLAEEQAKGAAPEHADWPPPTNHAPISACLACGSDDLVETRDSAIMFTVKDRPDASYVAYPTLLNIVVCVRCGRLEWFAGDASAFLSAYQHGKQTPRSLPGVPFPQGAPPPWSTRNPERPVDEADFSKPKPSALDPAPAADPPPKPKYRRRASDRDPASHDPAPESARRESTTRGTSTREPATEVLPTVKEADPPPKSRRTVRRIEKLER